MKSNTLIQAENVAFRYGRNRILEDVSLCLTQSEIVCIIGPNGSGKSTLLDCILGLLKLNAGRILIHGRSVSHLSAAALARRVAYVPQGHERTFPYTVFEIVLMGRAAYTGFFSAPGPKDRAVAHEALERVGIGHLKSRPYTRLSGGEGQLVLIARALAQQAGLIVMDEPTAHLDFSNEMRVLETIRDLVKDNRVGVIMATHFPNHAFYFDNNGVATRVAMLHQGRFLAVGAPREVLNVEQLQHLYGIEADIIAYDNGGPQKGRQIVSLRTYTPKSKERKSPLPC